MAGKMEESDEMQELQECSRKWQPALATESCPATCRAIETAVCQVASVKAESH